MNRYKDSVSKRDIIRKDIELALLQKPKNLEEILKILSRKGYEVKYGKHIAVKKKEDKRFLRLDSLGPGYTQQDLKDSFVKEVRIRKKRKCTIVKGVDTFFKEKYLRTVA